jgi:hypothetical protein
MTASNSLSTDLRIPIFFIAKKGGEADNLQLYRDEKIVWRGPWREAAY